MPMVTRSVPSLSASSWGPVTSPLNISWSSDSASVVAAEQETSAYDATSSQSAMKAG
jgi:hypothetical protein